MSAGRIFWAMFFIAVGVLGLINNFTVLDTSFWSIGRFWPVVLILIGLAVIIKDQKAKWITMGAVGFLAGVLVFSVFNYGFQSAWSVMNGHRHMVTQELVEDYDGSARATIRFNSGAGDFLISDTTSAFIAATTESNLGAYELRKTATDSLSTFTLGLENGDHIWGLGNLKNRVHLRLNPEPEWDVAVEIGAARAEMDLRPFRTRNVKISAGAATLELTLGDKAEENHTRIEAGAASIVVRVPQTVDCEVRLDAPLTSKSFEGFTRSGDDRYQSDGYGTAKKNVFLRIESGVSSLRLERY